MKRRFYTIVSIILIATIVAGSAYFFFSSCKTVNTPITLYSATISPENTGLISNVFNATQGATVQLALTLTSLMYSPQIEVPIQSLKIIGYNSTIDYGSSWDSGSWEALPTQGKVFNYSLSPTQLILQPNMPNTSIITVKLADNSPTGRYALEINLGKLKFLTPPGKNDLSYAEGIWLGMIVSLKSNATITFS